MSAVRFRLCPRHLRASMIKKILNYVEEDKFLILIPLLTIFTRFIIFLFIPNTYEDAFITFRYAENFAQGNGLVYNIGEHVYGTTVPLFALMLGVFKYLGVSCIVSSLSINLISEAITSLIVYKLLKDYYKGILAVIVALLYAFSPSNISWAIQGMETAFFTVLIALAFFSLYKKKYFLAMLFGFLCSILRIDGLSVPFIIFLFVFKDKKLTAFRYMALPFTLFCLWNIFLFLYFNSFLPNSMIAKLILYSGHSESMLPNLELVFSKFFFAGYYSSTILTVLFVTGIIVSIRKKPALLPMIIWFVIYYIALMLSKTHIFAWYLIPPLFVYITISGIGIIFLTETIIKHFHVKNLIAVIFIGVIFFSSITLYLKIKQIKQEFLYEQVVRKKIGNYFYEYSPKNSTIFLEPIGVIGYYSHRYIYDDAALISPQFLNLNRLPNIPETRYKKVQLVKPDYLVIRDKYLAEFYSKTALLSEYKPIKSFRFNYKSTDDFPDITIFQKK